jgi:(p)ppGpp synthase/HD superfamily hydrolase
MNKALQLAMTYHKNQTRKYSGLPYIVHCIDVHNLTEFIIRNEYSFSLPQDNKWYQAILDACYLHDTLEDTSITEELILENSSELTLQIVKELTNPSKGLKLPRAERKEIDRKHLSNISWAAKLIKYVDRYCNVRDLVAECDDKQFVILYLKESELLLEALYQPYEHESIHSALFDLIQRSLYDISKN